MPDSTRFIEPAFVTLPGNFGEPEKEQEDDVDLDSLQVTGPINFQITSESDGEEVKEIETVQEISEPSSDEKAEKAWKDDIKQAKESITLTYLEIEIDSSVF